jgi:hypothetical protein
MAPKRKFRLIQFEHRDSPTGPSRRRTVIGWVVGKDPAHIELRCDTLGPVDVLIYRDTIIEMRKLKVTR